MAQCLGCGACAVKLLVEFGSLPPSNRFVMVGRTDVDLYPLTLGQCEECALMQLVDPMPISMVRSRHAWLTYSEPEEHLDALVERLRLLVRPDSRIVGLTHNDDSTLARFRRLGFAHTLRYDMKADLGIEIPCAGLETIQSVLDDSLVDCLVARHGKADLLIVRYLLEHAHAPKGLLYALGRLLAPGGKLVLEVPDCTKSVVACDYSSMWEEHTTYYTQRTIRETLARNGFRKAETLVYEYALEDSLVAIADAPTEVSTASDAGHEREFAMARRFAGEFSAIRTSYRRHFVSLRKAGKRVALFGAGHFAAMFLNVFDLRDRIECVIDDNVNKQGLAMPGSRLPIVGSARLSDMDVCILCLGPESEQKVVAKHRSYVEAGGRFASIFARSPLALNRV